MEPHKFVRMMLSSLLDFQHRGVLCDTTLKAQGGDVPAHSIVLAATSAKLKRELVRIDSEPGMQHIVELPDFAVEDVKCVLKYVYTSLPPSMGSRDKTGVVSLCETLEIPQPKSWARSEFVNNGAVSKIEDFIDTVLQSSSSETVEEHIAFFDHQKATDEGNNQLNDNQGSSDELLRANVDEYPYKCETCKREFKRLAALRLHEKSHWATSADAMKKKKVHKAEKSSPLKTLGGRRNKQESSTLNSLPVALDTVTVDDLATNDSVLSPDKMSHLELIEVKKEIVEREILPKAHLCEKCDQVFTSLSGLNAHRRSEHSNVDNFAYVCDCCDRRFQFASNLIEHRYSHNERSCDYCGESFSSYVELYRHRFIHCKTKNETGDWLFSCRVCARQFPSKAAVREHRLAEHMRCNTCNRHFLKPCKLRRHEVGCQRRHGKLIMNSSASVAVESGDNVESSGKGDVQTEDGFLCGECGKVFSRLTSLVSHKKVHVRVDYYENITESLHYTCETCGRAFVKPSKLKQHEIGCQLRYAKRIALDAIEASSMEAVGEGAFKCSECNKVFDKAASLSSHKKIHAPDEFRCQTCGKVFTKRYYLVNHELSHSDFRPHKCAHCDLSFKQFSQMLRHVQRRHVGGPRPHMCSECGRTFAVKSDLKDHEGIHTGEKVHLCDQCGQQFRTRGILRVHQRQHTGARPFECKYCGRRFAQLSNRLKHETIHTGICPVKCDQCGRGFADTSALKRHELFHSGLRPHTCPVCNRTFALKSTLNAHIQIHDSVRHHVCPICNKAFVLRSGLARHLKIHARRANTDSSNLMLSTRLTGDSASRRMKVEVKNAHDVDSDEEEVAYEPDVLHAMYIAENIVEMQVE